MIKCNEGAVEIKGDIATIRAEFCVLAKDIRNEYTKLLGKEEANRIMDIDFADSKKNTDELIEDVMLKICEKIIARREKENGRNKEN